MWKAISNHDDILQFMEQVCHFHDSCIKEIYYLSGAYVTDHLSMFPINNCRILRVVIQRQDIKDAMIEMEFRGLKGLRLYPLDESFTCEISDATMIMKDESIYWCDCGGLSESDIDHYTGTMICASKLRWRSIENHMGKEAFYHSDV